MRDSGVWGMNGMLRLRISDGGLYVTRCFLLLIEQSVLIKYFVQGCPLFYVEDIVPWGRKDYCYLRLSTGPSSL